MKLLKMLILLPTFVMTACSGTKNQKRQNNNVSKGQQSSEYPRIVDSLGLQALFDSTKWRMYLLICDDTPMLRNGRYLFSPPKSFGALDLKFDSIWQRNDSIAFYFDFYLNDTLSLYKIRMSMYPRYLKTEYYNGILFAKNRDSFTTCYVSNHGYFALECRGPLSKKYYDTTSDRYINPLQPNVIKYIQKNKDQLNPWFRKEAEKRGIIK